MEKIFIYGVNEKGKKFARQLRYYLSKSETRSKQLFLFDEKNITGDKEYLEIPILSIQEAIGCYGDSDVVFSTDPQMSNKLYEIGFSSVYGGVDFLKYILPDTVDTEGYHLYRPFDYYESPYLTNEQIDSMIKNRSEKGIVGDINFNVEGQKILLNDFSEIDKPEWIGGRYIPDNGWFDTPSADALYYMMRYFKPERIIEIGSGYSTAAMLDINDKFFDENIDIT